MTQNDIVKLDDIIKKVRLATSNNIHITEKIECEIIRSATKIYLYEKYYEEDGRDE